MMSQPFVLLNCCALTLLRPDLAAPRPGCTAPSRAGHANRKDCAAVILYAAENATRMALDAIQILGGNGCVCTSLRSGCRGLTLVLSVWLALLCSEQAPQLLSWSPVAWAS